MNYPRGIKEKVNTINYANRGMGLESDLNKTNQYYLVNNIAVIYKKPTPITIKKLIISPTKSKLKMLIFKNRLLLITMVFIGKIHRFWSKETKNENSFPLRNIHKHQLEHLKKLLNMVGLVLIVRFITKDEAFYLDGKI